jgi:hypothetical protein
MVRWEPHRILPPMNRDEWEKEFEEYKNLADIASWTGDGLYSDISLMILASTKMPNYEIVYADAFPISLSGLNFNTVDIDIRYVEASATFRYTYYTISKI